MRLHCLFLQAAVALLAFLPFPAVALVQLGWHIQYTGDTPLNIRETASTNAIRLGQATKNAYGVILDGPKRSGGHLWYQIRWADPAQVGWSANIDLRALRLGNGVLRKGQKVDSSTALDMLRCPNVACDVVGKLLAGAEGEVLTEGPLPWGGAWWYEIKNGSDIVGYVKDEQLRARADSNPYFEGQSFPASIAVGSTATFSGTANDSKGIDRIYAYVKGPGTNGEWLIFLNSVQSGTESRRLSSFGLSSTDVSGIAGEYEIDLLARDTGGQVTDTSFRFTLTAAAGAAGPDTQLPTLNASVANQAIVNTPLKISGTANDNVGLSSVSLKVTNPDGTSKDIVAGSVSGSTYTLSTISFTPTQLGLHTLSLRAQDLAGNEGNQGLTFTAVVDPAARRAELEAERAKQAGQLAIDQARDLERRAALDIARQLRVELGVAQSTAQTTLTNAEQSGPFSYSNDATLRPYDPRPSLPQCQLQREAEGEVFVCSPAPEGSAEARSYPYRTYIVYGFRGGPAPIIGFPTNFPAIVQGYFLDGSPVECAGPICPATARYIANNREQLLRLLTAVQEQMRRAVGGESDLAESASWAAQDVPLVPLRIVSAWKDEIVDLGEMVAADVGLSAEDIELLGRETVSIALDLIPYIGVGTAAQELVTGTDLITGEPLSRWSAGTDIVLSFVSPARASKHLLNVSPPVRAAFADGRTFVSRIQRYYRKHNLIQTKIAPALLRARFGQLRTKEDTLAGNYFTYQTSAGAKPTIRRLDASSEDGAVGFEFKQGHVKCTKSVLKQVRGDAARLCVPGTRRKVQIFWASFESTNNPAGGILSGIDQCVKDEFKKKIESSSGCLTGGRSWSDLVKFEEYRCRPASGSLEFDCGPLRALD